MEDDILFRDDGYSAREEFYFERISKLKDEIINNCKKCDDGFIEHLPKVKKVEDLLETYAEECTCRKKANAIATRIYSGVPSYYCNAADIRLNIDAQAKEIVELYIDKMQNAFLKGYGLFLPSGGNGNGGNNLDLARSLCGIKIVLAALKHKEKYTAHYIEMYRLYDLHYQLIRSHNPLIEKFLEEIASVDFLFIDRVGATGNTQFVINNFQSILFQRSLNAKPTIISTSMTEEKLRAYLSDEVMNVIVRNSGKVVVREYHGKQTGFLNLRAQLGG